MNTETDEVKIDYNRALIFGSSGVAGYHINVSGGVEVDDVQGFLSDSELYKASRKIRSYNYKRNLREIFKQ